MSNEATIRVSLTIKKRSGSVALLDYTSGPTGYQATVDGSFGPTPGAVVALVTGTIVDFSRLVTAGFCLIKALFADDGDGNYVNYGTYDPQTNVFYPLGELGPGEAYVLKLSRDLLESFTGTGTGTTGPIKQFMVKAAVASANVSIEAFER